MRISDWSSDVCSSDLTHFAGVAIVVAKLFGLVRPDVAVFGQKDYQQLVVIRQMVADLCLGIDVVGAETIREPDGLAMSSRNRFLDPLQRQQATALSRTLRRAIEEAPYGADRSEEHTSELQSLMRI